MFLGKCMQCETVGIYWNNLNFEWWYSKRAHCKSTYLSFYAHDCHCCIYSCCCCCCPCRHTENKQLVSNDILLAFVLATPKELFFSFYLLVKHQKIAFYGNGAKSKHDGVAFFAFIPFKHNIWSQLTHLPIYWRMVFFINFALKRRWLVVVCLFHGYPTFIKTICT